MQCLAVGMAGFPPLWRFLGLIVISIRRPAACCEACGRRSSLIQAPGSRWEALIVPPGIRNGPDVRKRALPPCKLSFPVPGPFRLKAKIGIKTDFMRGPAPAPPGFTAFHGLPDDQGKTGRRFESRRPIRSGHPLRRSDRLPSVALSSGRNCHIPLDHGRSHPKIFWVKGLPVLHQGPGDDQHLGRQLHPHLGLDSPFLFPALNLIRHPPHEINVPGGRPQSPPETGRIANRTCPAWTKTGLAASEVLPLRAAERSSPASLSTWR